MAVIGEAFEYEAWITDALTSRPLVRLSPSLINWQRCTSNTSVAAVTVPYADGWDDCCTTIGGLHAWDQMVTVFRNNALVWDGPITGWSINQQGTLTLRGHDRSILTTRRLVRVDRLYTQTDLWDIVRQVTSDALMGNAAYDPFPWRISPASLDSGLLIDREYRADRLESLSNVFADLVSTAGLFWTQIGDTMYLNPQVFYSAGNAAYIDPVLNEQSIFGPIALEVDATQVATAVYVGRDGQGLAGFANYSTATNGTYTAALLEMGVSDGQTLADTQLGTVSAADLLAARSATPNVTLERIKLTPRFGSASFSDDLANLAPGAHFPVDFPNTCALDIPIVTIDQLDFETLFSEASIRRVRLDQLDVEVTCAGGNYSESLEGSFTAVADP